MNFFSKIFDGLASLSSKLPSTDFEAYFIIMCVVIIALGVVFGLTFLGSQAGKMKRASKKVLKYLEGVSEIDEDQLGEFTSQCFSSSVPRSMREAWVKYLGVRFGYPSDILSERDVFEKEVRRGGNLRANIFIGIALIAVAFLAFWGLGSGPTTEAGVTVGVGLLIAGAMYLVLVVLARKQYNSSRDAFYAMQDELDAKVNFQVEKDYSVDSSPLLEITAIIDEIVARNTARVIEVTDEEDDKEGERQSADKADVAAQPEPTQEDVEEDFVLQESAGESAQQAEEERADESVEKHNTDESEDTVDGVDLEKSVEDGGDELVEHNAESAVEVIEDSAESDVEVIEDSELSESALEDGEQLEDQADETAEGSNAEQSDDFGESEEMIQPAEGVDEASIPDDIDEEFSQPAQEGSESDAVEDEEEPEQGIINIEEEAEQYDAASDYIADEQADEQQVEDQIGAQADDIEIIETGNATLSENGNDNKVLREEGVNEWIAGQNAFGMADPVEAFEEVNIEDDKVMFGKKKKEAAPAPQQQNAQRDIFVEGELELEELLLEEVEEVAPVAEPAPVAPVAEPAPVAPVAEPAPVAPVTEPAPVENPVQMPEFKREIINVAPVVELSPEIIEEFEDLDEGDEEVKAARLAKLPHLVDYVLSMNVSKATKMKVAQLMMQAYVVFKNSPENKVIVVQCLGKIMASIQK